LQRHDFSQQPPAISPPAPPPAHVLDALHQQFAARFSQALHEALSIEAEIALLRTDVTRYSDFAWSRANPTCLSILRVEPAGMQIVLELAPGIAFPLIRRLLGGEGELVAQPLNRGLTQVEQGVALEIIERAATALADTWRSSGIESIAEEAVLNDPANARIMPPDEMVSVVTFHVSFESVAGSMSVCLPAPLTDLLAGTRQNATPTVADNVQRDRDTENITRNIMRSSIELRALLAETKLRLNDVLSLTEGDILTTDTPADAVVPLRFQGQPMLEGRLGELNGHRAVQIARSAGGQPQT
jgi:flagellar motor switch protein FliM